MRNLSLQIVVTTYVTKAELKLLSPSLKFCALNTPAILELS